MLHGTVQFCDWVTQILCKQQVQKSDMGSNMQGMHKALDWVIAGDIEACQWYKLVKHCGMLHATQGVKKLLGL